MSEIKKTTVLAMFYNTSIAFLIPKKNGNGYLKTPVGAHRNALCDFCDENFRYDVMSSGGCLIVDVGRTFDRDKITEEVIRPIAAYYGTEFIVLEEAEFWAANPRTKKPE